MHICIIGNGWYGCHVASYLLDKNIKVTIVDKCDTFFNGSSSKNQNRLHIGYHYPRSDATIIECKNGYTKFIERYGDFTHKIGNNYYFIHDNSIVNFDKYCNTFNITESSLVNIDNLDFKVMNVNTLCVNVNERHIDNEKASCYFESKLRPFFLKCNSIKLTYRDDKIEVNNIEFDHVINCTNNQWIPIKLPFTPIFETYCSLVYKINFKEVTAITVMDGPFFSIFPYDIKNNLYTVTHVKFGIISQEESHSTYNNANINDIRKNIEEHVLNMIPDIEHLWSYHGHFTSHKTKYDLITDDRSLRIFKDKNYTSFSGGKITGIFETEAILDSLISRMS